MNQVNRITIHAPLHKIFLAASDLTRWPEFLPHYRHNRFLSQTPSGGVVKMSSIHAGIPLTGIQEFQIDPERRELRFTHLRSTLNATRGLEAIWTFEEKPDGGVEVIITHQMAMSWPFFGRFLANKLVGTSLIRRIAGKTLSGLKRKVEAQQHAEITSAQKKKVRSPKGSPAAGPKAGPKPAAGVPKKAPTPKLSKKPAPASTATAKASAKPAPKKAAPAPKAAARPAPAKITPAPKAVAKPAPAKAIPTSKAAVKTAPPKAGPVLKPTPKKPTVAKTRTSAKSTAKPGSARKKK